MVTISFDITLFLGKQRAGKTISALAETYFTLLEIRSQQKVLESKKKLTLTEKKRLEILQNFKLMSNLSLNRKIYGKYIYITPEKLMEMYKEKIEIKNKLILFDDLFKKMDSRKSMEEQNITLSYFTTEIGKKQNKLLYVSHFTNRMELRLRTMTENFVVCKKGKIFKVLGKTGNFFNIWLEDKDYFKFETDEKELKRMVIKQEYYNEDIDFTKDFDTPIKKLKRIEYLKAYNFFKHYDTMEII